MTQSAQKPKAAQPQLWPQATERVPRGTPQNCEMFSRLDADLFLANQLFRHGRPASVLSGVTDASARRERIRSEIVDHGLGAALVRYRRDRPSETLSEAFTRLYGEPL